MVAARTAPNRAVRFGGEYDPLDGRGRRDAAALEGMLDGAPAIAGPERSVVQTAEAIGVAHAVDPRWRSLDIGVWRGMQPQDVPVADLAAWFTDPTWAGHGGESIAAFVARIAEAAASAGTGIAIVAKPVAQALLCGGASRLFTIDVRPATLYEIVR